MKEDDDNPADAGQMKLEGGNAINEKGCNHLFIKYPPVVGKIKTCIKCGILLAPGGIQGGYNTVRLSGNHIEMTVAAAPVNPASGLVRMYATSATSVRMRDSAGTETDLAAVTRAGGNTTEATTTSTTAVDIVSTAGISIAATTPFWVIGNMRRPAIGAGGGGGAGLKLNTTVVREAVVSNQALAETGTTAGGSGAFSVIVGSRVANYLRAAARNFSQSATLGVTLETQFMVTADMPTATITDVVIRGIVNDTGAAFGVDEVHIYALSTS